MAKGQSPAFQFYPSDWLSSLHVALMTPAQEGAFIRLLCHCWLSEDCGIPDDDVALAELSRLRNQWKANSPRIRAKFESVGGRLFNPRLIEERQKQAEWREKSSAGGKKSAATRAEAKLKGGSRVVEECLEPNANSSSSSSSSSSIKPLNPCSADAELEGFALENGPLNSRNSYGKAWFDREHDAWYAGYWCKAGRQDSRKAHEKRLRALVSGGLTHEDAAAFLVRMAAEDRASFEGTADWSWRAKLHPATWLNGERWTDQAVTSKGPVIPAARGKDFMADVANVIGGRIARGDEPW